MISFGETILTRHLGLDLNFVPVESSNPGWLVGCLVGYLVGWLVAWFVAWLLGWLLGWLFSW